MRCHQQDDGIEGLQLVPAPPQQQKFGMAPWAKVLSGVMWIPDGVQDQGGALLEGEPTPRSSTHWLGSQAQTWKLMQEKHLTPFND